MAPEQPSQPHLPPARPDTTGPSPAGAEDPLGTVPRLPRLQSEPRPDIGSRPPAGTGWEPATTSGSGLGQTSGWDQATATGSGLGQTSGWDQALAGNRESAPRISQEETDGAAQPSAPADNAVWPPTPPPDNAVWPPASPIENTAWLPSIPVEGAPSGGASSGTESSPFAPSWVNAPLRPPAEDPLSGGGSPLGGDNTPGGFGVPDNPTVWGAAAAVPGDLPAASPQGQAVPDASLQAPSPTRSPYDQAPSPTHSPYDQAPQHGPPPPQEPPSQQGRPPQPDRQPSREPSDPYRPFVTAGQISGPKTPPPERQQELWDTVFGDNYQAMGEEDDLDGDGKPVWVFALAGSVVIALVGALFWAFMAGPLAAAKEETSPRPTPQTTPKKPTKAQTPGRLPRFPGKGSPVGGTLSDKAAAISVARLGAPWRQDQRPTVPTVYGFTTRQYVPAGTDSAGRAQSAQLMLGTLSPLLKSKYIPENLSPAINAVASGARKKFFPEGNIARKTAQQSLSAPGLRGRLSAYEITAGDSKTTLVVAVVNTGADLPAVVYMSVPGEKKELLPDINTVFGSIRTAAS